MVTLYDASFSLYVVQLSSLNWRSAERANETPNGPSTRVTTFLCGAYFFARRDRLRLAAGKQKTPTKNAVRLQLEQAIPFDTSNAGQSTLPVYGGTLPCDMEQVDAPGWQGDLDSGDVLQDSFPGDVEQTRGGSSWEDEPLSPLTPLTASPFGSRPPSPQHCAVGVYSHMPPGPGLRTILPGSDAAVHPQSPFAIWDGQRVTRLPFIPAKHDPSANALVTVWLFTIFLKCLLMYIQMGPHVEKVVMDVKDARGSLYVDYYPYSEDIAELALKVRGSMGKGRYAVVEGCPEVYRVELSLADMHKHFLLGGDAKFQAHGEFYDLFSSNLRLMLVQDMLRREDHFTTPQIQVTLGEFIDNLRDPHLIQAILDSPHGASRHPLLVG